MCSSFFYFCSPLLPSNSFLPAIFHRPPILSSPSLTTSTTCLFADRSVLLILLSLLLSFLPSILSPFTPFYFPGGIYQKSRLSQQPENEFKTSFPCILLLHSLLVHKYRSTYITNSGCRPSLSFTPLVLVPNITGTFCTSMQNLKLKVSSYYLIGFIGG